MMRAAEAQTLADKIRASLPDIAAELDGYIAAADSNEIPIRVGVEQAQGVITAVHITVEADDNAKLDAATALYAAAKDAGDAEEMDRIADALAQFGVVIEDGPHGPTWRKVGGR